MRKQLSITYVSHKTVMKDHLLLVHTHQFIITLQGQLVYILVHKQKTRTEKTKREEISIQ